MNCAEIRNLLDAHVDDELDRAGNLEVEKHLESCAACAAHKKSLLSLRAALQNDALRFSAPESLKRDALHFAREMDAGRQPREKLDASWLWKIFAIGATALALAMFYLRPSGLSNHDLLLNEVVAGHVRSLQAEHLTDVASSDQHTVKPWFDGKLDFAPDVRDFVGQGFPLLGGRLDYLNNRTVAALVYRRNKHLINVFIWPSPGSGLAGKEITTRRGYSIVEHDAKGMHYFLVSDLNAGELKKLSDLLE